MDNIGASKELTALKFISSNKLMINSTDLTNTLELLNRSNYVIRDIESNLTGSENFIFLKIRYK